MSDSKSLVKVENGTVGTFGWKKGAGFGLWAADGSPMDTSDINPVTLMLMKILTDPANAPAKKAAPRKKTKTAKRMTPNKTSKRGAR
jgi:hypothetical protein